VKAIFAISLALLILLQPLSKMLLVVEYQVNKNYIAAVLCENKTKPQLQCNGKCHLNKELKEAEKQEQKLPAPLKEKLEVLYFCQAITPAFLPQIPTVSENGKSVYKQNSYTPPAFGIFHPPRFLV
jgi:hypothetical protein